MPDLFTRPWRRLRILIGMEASGAIRSRLVALGHDAWSCDLRAASDGSANHLQCDVFDIMDHQWDMAVFHPTCTFLTCSAEWAYGDIDFNRYPGVGYHQKVKPETPVGKERRDARDAAVAFVHRLDKRSRHIPVRLFENPKGCLSKRWRKPTQVIQPYDYGDDASKATCVWIDGAPLLHPTLRVLGRRVEWPRGSGRIVERWANQTDSGQNRLSPSDDRWSLRSDTYPGIAAAIADQLPPYAF